MNEKKGETMSKEQIIKDFMKKPINKEAKNNQTNETETTNIVTLPNGLKLKINPTKLKYFKSGDFATCSLIKTLGVSVLITKYADGYEVLCRYLSAIFDKPYTKIQRKNEETEQYSTECVFDEYITNLLDNELSMIDIENIIDTAFKVNHIKAEDFLSSRTEQNGVTIERGVALIALHLGEIDEQKIYEITYPFFNNLIREISLQLNFQAISNLLGNPYAGDKGLELVNISNPLNCNDNKDNKKNNKVTMKQLKALMNK